MATIHLDNDKAFGLIYSNSVFIPRRAVTTTTRRRLSPAVAPARALIPVILTASQYYPYYYDSK